MTSKEDRAKKVAASLEVPPLVRQYADSHAWTFPIARQFGVDWTERRIHFPLYDWRDEELYGWWERRLIEQPRWMPNGDGFEPHRHVYGLHAVSRTIAQTNLVLIVESPACVIALASIGFPLAVALCGDHISQSQAMEIRRWASRGVIWADKGTGGAVMASKTTLMMRDLEFQVLKTFVWGVDPASCIAHDPDLAAERLMGLLDPYIDR
jgi:DNA primase